MKKYLYTLSAVVLILLTVFSFNVFASNGEYTPLSKAQTIYATQNTPIKDADGTVLATLPKGSAKENTAVMLGYKDSEIYINYNGTEGFVASSAIVVVAEEPDPVESTTKTPIEDIIVSVGQGYFSEELTEIRNGTEEVVNTGHSFLKAFDNILSMIRDFFSNILNFILDPGSSGIFG